MSTYLSDEALDEFVRALPPVRTDPAQLERVRSLVLATVGGITPAPRRTIGPRALALIAAPMAIAAAAVLWLAVGREDGRPARSHATLVPGEGAQLTRVGAPPDEIVHLQHGSLLIDVTGLERGHRFRVITSDAEIEVQAARFVVAASGPGTTAIEVSRGRVWVRPATKIEQELEAGERWTATPPIESAAPPAPAPAANPPSGDVPAPPATRPAPSRSATSRPARRATERHGPAPASPSTRTPSPPEGAAIATAPSTQAAVPIAGPMAPGEAEFRAGWDALRRGQPGTAATSFSASRRAAGQGAIAEDASFWEGVALARAGRPTAAIAALRRFLADHRTSARAGEASARLGWLLLDAGEHDAAARLFESALADPVPSVRRSARAGLDKIAALGAP